MNYEIRYVRGHVEVYDQAGRFRSPADEGGEVGEGGEQPAGEKRRKKQRAPAQGPGRPL